MAEISPPRSRRAMISRSSGTGGGGLACSYVGTADGMSPPRNRSAMMWVLNGTPGGVPKEAEAEADEAESREASGSF